MGAAGASAGLVSAVARLLTLYCRSSLLNVELVHKSLRGSGGLGVLVGSHSECSSIWTSGPHACKTHTFIPALC